MTRPFRHQLVEAQWDAEYARGRYQVEEPIPFVQDIYEAIVDRGLTGGRGLYVGCGNGRNFIPLVSRGLIFDGVDLSGMAIRQLGDRLPEYAGRLVHGTLADLPTHAKYDFVVGIQVFQHGSAAEAARHMVEASARLKRGGLFCLRVNAVGTDIVLRHDIVSSGASERGRTIRYREGPKSGQFIHFFDETELRSLFPSRMWSVVIEPRLIEERRDPRLGGVWCQWEAIWQLTRLRTRR